ncbi:MAG: 2-amino-4-hydroxy-6-hydroxymethyldihydropteridine diphosphokinase [Puniceicoccales bacterium]|jgi:2-amino-4-hydroxy-6-hydroxymethyldihydropteridine diphosphokinase|nr:2-amino-4-hydroxy-6-hydroxymethyldihydropteridine diphosphokinase [Puniceicoccales bacterium]
MNAAGTDPAGTANTGAGNRWRRAILALGANLGDRAANIAAGVAALDARSDTRLAALSPLIETDPVGCAPPPAAPVPVPKFLNATAAIETTLAPEQLLAAALEIETSLGRTRPYPNAPRPLDIDLLFFEDESRATPALTLPHPRWAQRAFVREPLAALLQTPPLAGDPRWRALVPENAATGGAEITPPAAPPLLDIRNLVIRFRTGGRETTAVNGISLTLETGKILAVVGESGSGKSVTSLAVARLLPPPPACAVTGEILFADATAGGTVRDLLTLSESEMRPLRGREIACVFQEPRAALNPAFTVGWQLAETIRLHHPGASAGDVRERVAAALEEVGIRDARARCDAYPHELSGGMAQRVMLAIALAGNPRLLIADEPTTALDATVQQKILRLLAELRSRRSMAVLLVTHNFGVVAGLADEVAVFHHGTLVERGTTGDVLRAPQRDYTRHLLACVPRLRANMERRLSSRLAPSMRRSRHSKKGEAEEERREDKQGGYRRTTAEPK